MEVHVSELSNIKSVFNSTDDNLHYYRVLHGGVGTRFGHLELAEPVIQSNHGLIKWRIDREIGLRGFDNLTEEERSTAGRIVEEGFRLLDDKLRSFRNAPNDLKSRLMEVPSSSSIYVVGPSPVTEVILVNWGFLYDKLDRQTGVLQSIFPPPDFGILAKLTTAGGISVSGKVVVLSAGTIQKSDVTDANGLARLGSLKRGEYFELSSPENEFSAQVFVCDQRPVYSLILQRNVKLTFRIRYGANDPAVAREFGFWCEHTGKQFHRTDESGQFEVEVPDVGYDYTVYDEAGRAVHASKSTSDDELIDIHIDEDRLEPKEWTPEPESEDQIVPSPFVLEFLKRGDNPIGDFPFVLEQKSNSEKREFRTDSTGKVLLDRLIPAEAYRVTFAHKGSDWSYDFIEPSGLSGHRFVLSPSIPWLWWILNFILLSLLLWCLFGSACWCNLFSASPNSIHNDEEHYYGEAIPCNAQVASGGAGVTENIHELGTSSGTISVSYNMENVPDLLEVFYGGQLVASTQSVVGNDNGYVGGNNSAGCCGELIFAFDPRISSQCKVRVTGPDSTTWDYRVDCGT